MKTFLIVCMLLTASTCFADSLDDYFAQQRAETAAMYREIANLDREIAATSRSMDNTFIDIIRDQPARVPTCTYVIIGGMVTQQCW